MLLNKNEIGSTTLLKYPKYRCNMAWEAFAWWTLLDTQKGVEPNVSDGGKDVFTHNGVVLKMENKGLKLYTFNLILARWLMLIIDALCLDRIGKNIATYRHDTDGLESGRKQGWSHFTADVKLLASCKRPKMNSWRWRLMGKQST